MMDHTNKTLFPFLLVFFEMATYLSSDMYLPALPTVMDSFSITHQDAQWTLSAWFLGAVSVQLILGPIADRIGRKPVLCFGGIIFMVSTLLCAFTNSFYIFLVARFIQGTGICFMAVPGYATIHELFEQKEAIKILALMGSIAVIGPAFGPLLGSSILFLLNWHWIFIFLSVWSTISVVLLIIFMPETLPAPLRHPLKPTTILQNYWKILRNFRFIGMVIVYGLLFFGFITWIAAGPFLVIDTFNESPFMFGVYQTLIFASYIFSNYLVKKLIENTNPKKLVQFGLAICLGVSFIALIPSILFPHFMLTIIGVYIVYAFGSGFAFAPLNRLAIEKAADAPMGSRMAIFSTLMNSFAALSSIFIGLFYKDTLFSLALIIFSAMLAAVIIERVIRY